MLGVSEARAKLLNFIAPLDRFETVPLEQAIGRYAAENVVADIPAPPFRRSVMDGFAIYEQEAGQSLALVGEVAAGQVSPPLSPGEAIKISTGAPVPDGATRVVPRERAEASGGRVFCQPTDQPWIRPTGDDIPAGKPLVSPGDALTLGQVMALRTQNRTQIRVAVRPRVNLVVTGSEIIQPGQTLNAGQVYDIQSLSIPHVLGRLGFETQVFHAKDELTATREAFEQPADLIFSTGGVSAGDHDFVRPSLDHVEAHKVRMQPGKPFAFGRVNQTPVVCLPGNPSSSLVTLMLFGLPALARLQGGEYLPPCVSVRVGESIEQAERWRFLRSQLIDGLAYVVPNQDSGRVWPWAQADGLLEVPGECDVEAGDTLSFMPFRGLL